MRRIISLTCAGMVAMISHGAFAEQAGLMFNIMHAGTSLSVNTTIPNHTYPYAGVKVNTPGFSLSGVGSQCTMDSNGYCLFSVSDTQPATISIAGGNGTYSATFCLSGKGPLSCQMFNDLQVTPRFAYLANYGNSPSVLLCSLSPTGAIQSCQDSGGGIPTSFGANGIILNSTGTAAFLTGDTGHILYQCTINPADATFTSCSPTTVTTPSGYGAEYGMIAINPSNTMVYFGDNSGARVLACPVTNNVISGNCVNTGATGLNHSISDVILNKAGTKAYFVSYSPVQVTSCTVNGSTFSACTTATTAGSNTLDEPGGLTLNNSETILYITDYGNGRVFGCTPDLSSCFIATTGITDVWGIRLNANNTVAYLTNFAHDAYNCPILSDGTFGACVPNVVGSELTGIALEY